VNLNRQGSIYVHDIQLVNVNCDSDRKRRNLQAK